MNKAVKYRVYPTTEQSVMFAKTFGCCRKVYNLMLADKIEILDSPAADALKEEVRKFVEKWLA